MHLIYCMYLMYTINSEQCLGKCHCKARLSSTHLWSPHWRNWGQRITMPRLHSKTLSCLKVITRHMQCGMWTDSHNRVWESSISGPHAWRKQKQSLPYTLVEAKMQAFFPCEWTRFLSSLGSRRTSSFVLYQHNGAGASSLTRLLGGVSDAG